MFLVTPVLSSKHLQLGIWVNNGAKPDFGILKIIYLYVYTSRWYPALLSAVSVNGTVVSRVPSDYLNG